MYLQYHIQSKQINFICGEIQTQSENIYTDE